MNEKELQGEHDLIKPSGLSRRTVLSGGVALTIMTAVSSLTPADRARAATGPWGGYSNGQIPEDALMHVDYPGVNPNPPSNPRLLMKPDAGVALLALVTAFTDETGGHLPVDEGYRSLALQQHYWDLYGPPRAGVPGTSNHGWGQAVDFWNPPVSEGHSELAWLRSNAARFGYTELSGEPWHWNYSGTYTPPITIPIAPPRRREEEESMYSIVETVEGAIYIVGRSGKREQIQTPAHVLLLLRNKYGRLDSNNQPKDKFEMDRMYTSELDTIAYYLNKVNA
jgi:hypothetical protein